MTSKRIKLLLILLINITAISGIQIATGAEQSVIYEQCYICKIKDKNIGYSCSIQKQDYSDNKNLIITNTNSQQEFERFGSSIKLTQNFEYIENANGVPVSFSSDIDSPGENIQIKGRFISENKLVVDTTINGSKTSKEIILKKKILFPYAIEQLFKTAQSNTLEYSTIEPSTNIRIMSVTAEKNTSETILSTNKPVEGTKYRVYIDLLPNINNYEWRDNNGRLIKEVSSIMNMEQIAVDRDRIPKNVEKHDISDQMIIPVETDINPTSQLEHISYKIETDKVNPNEIFPSDERQRILQIIDNIAYIKIKDEQYKNSYFKYPVNTKGLSEYLKTGPFIISDNNLIKNQANELVKQENDAYKIVKKAENWVYKNITQKDFSVNFANSVDVFKSKKGDCTEHAILLASLLRAANIPSKVVIGLVYTDIPQKAFSYHMWVKAYIGSWINLDPSVPAESFSPTHISLYESPLNDLTDKTDMILEIMNSFASFKIKILNYSIKASPITEIQLSKHKQDPNNKADIISFLKENSAPVKQISIKNPTTNSSIINIDIQNKTREDFIRSAFYNFSKGKINLAKNDFLKASESISFSDDYSTVKLGLKLSALGLFNIAESEFKNISQKEIWDRNIQEIKTIYFPLNLPDPENELLLAEALSKINYQSDFNGAIRLIEANFNKLNKYDYTHYLLGKAYLEKSEYEPAINQLNLATEKNPSNLSYRLALAKAYTQNNELKKAGKELEIIYDSKINDEKFIELVNLESNWLKFKNKRGNDSQSQYYLAKYYSEKGELQTAIDILNKLANNKCEEVKVYELLGQIYLSQNQIDKAQENFDRANKLDKKSINAKIGIGDIKLINKDYKGALETYLHAEKIKEDSIESLLKIAQTYQLLSQEEMAYQYYDKILIIDPRNYTANRKIGVMHLNLGEIDKAKSLVKEALSVNPMDCGSWIELAKMEIKNKNYFLAKNYLMPVNHIDPNNPEYYYYSGLIDKVNENYTSAIENFRKAIQLKPDYSQAIQELTNK